MKFGPASPADAIGGVTVHTLRQGPLVLKKGTMIGPAEVDALNEAGVREVVYFRGNHDACIAEGEEFALLDGILYLHGQPDDMNTWMFSTRSYWKGFEKNDGKDQPLGGRRPTLEMNWPHTEPTVVSNRPRLRP